MIYSFTSCPRSIAGRGQSQPSVGLLHDDANTRYQLSHPSAKAITDTRAVLPSTALVALEAAQHARLDTAGTPMWTRRLAGGGAVDATLAALAHLPTCNVWRQHQEA